MSAGKQFMEMSAGDGGANLILADEKSKTSVQVNVTMAEKGSDVHIIATRPAAR
jgi:hypothetical protein